MTISIRPVGTRDFDAWRALYRAYADFYAEPQTNEQVERVWSWLIDPDHDLQAVVAVNEEGQLLGLGHFRPYPRPLGASTGCFLDDLFVSPDARGTGAADALLNHLRCLAYENGWSVVRWITAEDNYRARAKYDQHAMRTTWIIYDMSPRPT